jgi:hypothetical protein
MELIAKGLVKKVSGYISGFENYQEVGNNGVCGK